MKKVRAKGSSLFAQIIAALWIAMWSTREFLTSDHVDIQDVIYSGFAIAGCFLPVFVSIVTDKIKGTVDKHKGDDYDLSGIP